MFLFLFPLYLCSLNREPIHSNASFWFWIFSLWQSSIDRLKYSLKSFSVPINSNIYYSFSTPIALNIMKIGTNSMKLLDLQYTLWFLTLTSNLDLVSNVSLATVANICLVLESFSIMILFLAIYSCINATFSTPLIMKYPFGSYGHSFSLYSSSLLFWYKWQWLLPNIIGILPITMSFFINSLLFNIYSIFT